MKLDICLWSLILCLIPSNSLRKIMNTVHRHLIRAVSHLGKLCNGGITFYSSTFPSRRQNESTKSYWQVYVCVMCMRFFTLLAWWMLHHWEQRYHWQASEVDDTTNHLWSVNVSVFNFFVKVQYWTAWHQHLMLQWQEITKRVYLKSSLHWP